jgi:hypothetical protein
MSKDKSSIVVNEAATKKTIPAETFSANGIVYQFTAYSFVLDGEEWLASEALEDDKVLATLVSIKSGVIEAVGEEEEEEKPAA